MNFGMNQTVVDGGGLYCPQVVSNSPPPADEPTQKVIQQCDVTVHDVLLGRGRGPNMHPGNQRYREIIYANRENYNKASNRTEQTRITREIVNHIKQKGRFLKRLETPKNKKKKKRGETAGDAWVVVSDATARLKVGQCLRYKLRQDAEDKDDGSLGDIDHIKSDEMKDTETKFTGGAILPPSEKTDVVESEPVVSFQQQPSRKYRKVAVEVQEEPALSQEELDVLKSIGRSGLVLDEDDDDDESFDGFLESSFWEAKPANSLLIEDDDEPVPREFTMGSFYDSMFDANGGSYDSNFAYGTDIISDAEVLTALGYPQPPSAPTSRPGIRCHCGCLVKPSDGSKHHHECVPRRGIFAGSNTMRAPLKKKEMMSIEETEDNNICGIIEPVNMNSNSDVFDMAPNQSSGMTPMSNHGNWNVPIQSDPPQSSGGYGGAPFHVPDSAPMARPRMYRPFMPSQNAF